MVGLEVSFFDRRVFGCQFHRCLVDRKVEMQVDETLAFRCLLCNFAGGSLRLQVLQFFRRKSRRDVESNWFAS